MGTQTQWPTWVVCQLVFATLSLLFLPSCGSDTPGSSRLQKGPTAIIKISNLPAYDFGIREINTSTEATFTVSNTGTARATKMTGSFHLSMAFSFKGGSYPGTDGTCSADLDVGLSCTVVTVFRPPQPSHYENPLQLSYFNGLDTLFTNEPLLTGRGN